MFGATVPSLLKRFLSLLVPALALAGCSASQPPAAAPRPTAPLKPYFTPPPDLVGSLEKLPPVMLGIDVLEAEGFAPLQGKRIGLLTHPAGVDRHGNSTVDVLRHAPGVKLVALYGPEHGIYGDAPATITVPNTLDKRTGLPVYSLYGQYRKPTRAMLKGIDAMVIDLQDIGTRSYTYASAMKLTMEACFEYGVEVVVLDRPNPLGGLKVDGPLLDASQTSYVGEFCVPYVHGLTIGELALMAKALRPPTGLNVSDAVRARGKLLVVPMRGWRRSMRWPETGLHWIPTSPMMQDFPAVEGYPMVGLGTYFDRDPKVAFDIGFYHGIGKAYPFRGISHKTAKIDVVEKELRALRLPGLQFRRVSGIDEHGKPAVGLYVEITDYEEWHPTELNFYLMKLACKLDPVNPFTHARDASGFLHHLGSVAFYHDLQVNGARIDIEKWLRLWREQDLVYQQQSRRYWLYQ